MAFLGWLDAARKFRINSISPDGRPNLEAISWAVAPWLAKRRTVSFISLDALREPAGSGLVDIFGGPLREGQFVATGKLFISGDAIGTDAWLVGVGVGTKLI